MKKALKKIGKILLGIVAAAAVLLLGTFVYDKICLASEKDLLENQIYGQKVEVDGHRMSVYVSGEGKHTLVFMAGSGDSGPIFSFKDFADRFEDCRVVIIERFGYGFSDGFDGPRDVETRVSQDRKALEAAGVEGPFILCPHSYSGLETVYWAQTFPEEVEAIVGLDMAVPATYDTFDDSNVSQNNSSNALMRTLRKMGIVRLLAGSRMGKEFSPEEEKTAMALVCSRYCNETYAHEADYLISDRDLVESRKMPDVPTLLIVSDGSIFNGWIDLEKEYASQISDATTVQLNCGHAVFSYEPDACEKAMRDFINRLEK